MGFLSQHSGVVYTTFLAYKVNKPYRIGVYGAFTQYDFNVWQLFINFEAKLENSQ